MEGTVQFISFCLRIATPFMALIVVLLCFASLRGSRRREQPLMMLRDIQNDIDYPVLYWENSIGRSRGCDIRLSDMTVSRDHAVLLRRNEGWFITDTESRAGVYVNNEKAEDRCPVSVGDRITLGTTILTLRRAGEAGSGAVRRTVKNTIPSALMLSLITLYISVLTIQIILNTGDASCVVCAAGFTAVMWVFYALSSLLFKRPNIELEALAMLLTGTGIMVSSAHNIRQSYVQLAAFVVGLCIYSFILWFIERPDRVNKWYIAISVCALLLLASTLVLGSTINGAKNWIILGPVSIQPSEFAKIAYIFVGASTLDVLQTRKSLTLFIIMSFLTIGLLVLMSDFGSAVIFFVTLLIIAFMRSGDLKTVILAVTAAGLGVVIMLTVKPYIAQRFEAWGHVWQYADSSGYQQVNSLIYSASGGVFGMGIGKGWLQNLFASENDLVFCLICEECGCFLALLIAAVIGGFMLYARALATRSRSTFYSISACSAAGLLVFQASLNIFGVTDILPLTGVTLPFVSYGGSSLAACWGLLAFIKAADERTYARRRKHKETASNNRQRVAYEEEYVEI